MELRVLKYFIEVAREQNITAAAERLYITQSTLSKQLMELEKELGKQLLVRGKRRTTLTDDGMFLFRRAQEIVELADRTEAAFKTTDDVITGDISIGCGETEGMNTVIAAMQRMNEAYPDVHFHLYSGNDEDVSERLLSGLIDFGLFVGSTDLDQYDYVRLSESDVWGLVVRKDHPLAQKPSVRPADLFSVPILCARQAISSNELAGWLGQDLSELNIRATYNLVHNAALMAKAGMGCVLTIDKLIPEGGELVFRPLEPTVRADLAFAWKKHQVFSKAAEKFLSLLQGKG